MSSTNLSSISPCVNKPKLNRPRRMSNQFADENTLFYLLFTEGYLRFCTCGENCSYMENKSEACDKYGDSGERFTRYCDNLMFVNFC